MEGEITVVTAYRQALYKDYANSFINEWHLIKDQRVT